jgi:signal transduction histidine kinase
VLECVQKQATGMSQIVEMLLFLARADAESCSPQLEAVSLTAWLGAYVQRWAGHDRAANLRLQCASNDACSLNTHPPLLRQLLDNLIENACKHTPPGTPITVRLWREEKLLAVAVEDAGPGIAPEDLPHIFEHFYRSAQARRRGISGVGLGLAVAKRIAVHLGGTLHAESEPAAGARFTLRLKAEAIVACESTQGAQHGPML